MFWELTIATFFIQSKSFCAFSVITSYGVIQALIVYLINLFLLYSCSSIIKIFVLVQSRPAPDYADILNPGIKSDEVYMNSFHFDGNSYYCCILVTKKSKFH